jgi:hypothetical protein
MNLVVDCSTGCSSAAGTNLHSVTSYILVYQFLILLVAHWLADFVLQTHWQASNKSKNDEALGRHVLVYTLVLSVGVDIAFPGASWRDWGMFVTGNGFLHFWTDYVTSRMTSRLFAAQLNEFDIVLPSLIHWPNDSAPTERRTFLKRDFTLHNFFIVVGLDQLIHQATLALTMIYFLGAQ